MLKLVQVILWAALLAATPMITLAQTNSADSRAIDDYVATQARDAHIPGLSLGVVNADGSVHVRGFGQTGPAGQAVTGHTPFIIGSMSKSFTALAVMQLVEQGQLELDAPVQRYIPWFHVADPLASSKITVRHLLTQTSGIPTSAVKELQAGAGTESIAESVRRLGGVQLSAPVGTAFKYSNMNYVTLGLVIETVSGVPYGAYVQRHIFDPLGMRDSFVAQPAARDAGLATAYRWLFGVPVPAELPYEPSLLPAGFLISSADDMARYLSAQLDGGSSILSPSGVAELHHAAAPMYPGADYALGWVTSQAADHSAVWHNGVTAGFAGDMLLLPDAHIGVVVLTNVYGFGLEDYVDFTPQTIAESVAGLLVGGTQPPTTEFLSTAYLIFDVVAALIVALVVVSLARLVRGRSRPTRWRPWHAVPLLWEFLLPTALLVLILQPLLGPLPVLLLYAPDLTCWLLTIALLLLATGATRVALAATALHIARKRRYEPVNA